VEDNELRLRVLLRAFRIHYHYHRYELGAILFGIASLYVVSFSKILDFTKLWAIATPGLIVMFLIILPTVIYVKRLK
jgi:hypothetical protein